MADNEEGEENTTRGADWEVVSLTASTYAAAPGPEQAELKDDDNVDRGAEAETSQALFMSGHFVFPPSQHENLPLEPDYSETPTEQVGKEVASEVNVEEGNRSDGKGAEDLTLKGLEVSDGLPGIMFDEKGNRLSISGSEFEENVNLESGKSIYSTATFSTLHSEAEFGGSTTYSETLHIPEADEHSDSGLDVPTDVSRSPNPIKDDKYDGSNLPCEAWWKKRAASMYANAKDANAFWSIFIAAAVMGLVILGHRWQQERWQALQLKWQATINSERGSRMMGPIYRLKDVLVGGHRRGSFIRGSSSVDN